MPLYDYGVSQHFKAWADTVIAGAGATTPSLMGKPTVLAIARGGGYCSGIPRGHVLPAVAWTLSAARRGSWRDQ